MSKIQKRENKLEIKSFWKPMGSPSPMYIKLLELLLRKPKGDQVGIQESNKNS